MTPEQRGELKAAAFAATPGPWEATRQTDDECNFVGYFIEAPNKTISDDGTAPDANDALYIAAANPSAILSLIAQVEALTVPQVYIVEADYNHDGNQAVRAFSCKADAETFAAALNAYQESEPRTSWGDAEHKAWAAAHPVPEFLAADGFDIVDVPFGLPTIPAIPGTKEGA